MDPFGALVTLTEHLVLGMFWQHNEHTQLILVLVFLADVGPRFLSMPALSSRMRSRPAGMACSLPKKVGSQTVGPAVGMEVVDLAPVSLLVTMGVASLCKSVHLEAQSDWSSGLDHKYIHNLTTYISMLGSTT